MIKAERKQLIISHVSKDQKVLLSELSTLLNVSEDTVRRDIRELSDEGLLKAVRGGAILHSPIPLHFRDREHYDVSHKQIIAEKALRFIKDGQVVLFDSGTSALVVATHLPKERKITAITNSFPVASVLEDHPNAEVIFIGGRLNKTAFSTSGHEVIRTLGGVSPDICFLGICSIDIHNGVTGKDYEDSQVKKMMVEKAKRVIALSTLEKIGTAEPYLICTATAIDTIITDIEPTHADLLPYTAAGIEIV
uniref:DeoR/GlpR family DNA-binding transcription regulator n=1 Tax=Pedobacter schmidteae TaxID=2201271 RepID=UPI000EB01237|nr:DeoR/GlpR family DNA-binding transcription regulator [Pedobacter schmidteae]